jgi:hypothetical protein
MAFAGEFTLGEQVTGTERACTGVISRSLAGVATVSPLNIGKRSINVLVPTNRSDARFFLLCILTLAARALPLKKTTPFVPYLPTS